MSLKLGWGYSTTGSPSSRREKALAMFYRLGAPKMLSWLSLVAKWGLNWGWDCFLSLTAVSSLLSITSASLGVFLTVFSSWAVVFFSSFFWAMVAVDLGMLSGSVFSFYSTESSYSSSGIIWSRLSLSIMNRSSSFAVFLELSSLIFTFLYLSDLTFTFPWIGPPFFSWQSSNDSWLRCQSCPWGTWWNWPIGCLGFCGGWRGAIPLHCSNRPCWYRGLGGCAIVRGIACRFFLSWTRPTWHVFWDDCPLLGTILVNKFDKELILFRSPCFFSPYLRHQIHLEVSSL